MSPAAGTGLAGELGCSRREDSKGYQKLWREKNRDKSNAYHREYYHNVIKKDPKQLKAKLTSGVWTRRKAKYGITKPEYDALVLNQKGRCAICKDRVGDALRVDHDHETGKVRALLCTNCNSAFGLFKENRDTLANALNYHEKHCQKK